MVCRYRETVDRLENEIKQAKEEAKAARHSFSFTDSGGHSTIDEVIILLIYKFLYLATNEFMFLDAREIEQYGPQYEDSFAGATCRCAHPRVREGECRKE
jgi:hypothetical protein